MSVVERDPAGMLERVPELAPLAEAHSGLRRAIEMGKPHAAYRALFWLRLSGKSGKDATLIRQLLATRRLFFQPLIGGAPTMFTYNGIGARPYGNAEPDANDGSHILTLFFVIFFVPVYPFSSYLVRSAGSSGWTFFGKVPLSAACFLWQRAIALAGVVAVVFGAVNAFGGMRYNTVQLVNALPAPVTVKVGTESVLVMPHTVGKARPRVGTQDVVVELDGKVLERGQLHVKRGYDVNAWNVLGAGALYHRDVVYTAKDSNETPSEAEPDIHCGEREVFRDDVDYVFTTPPEEIKMGEHEKVAHRSFFGLAEVPPLACVFSLQSKGRAPEAKALALAVAKASEYDFPIVERAVEALTQMDDENAAVELLDSARKQHDGVIEFHRSYQTQAISAGHRDAVLADYRERAAAHPESADATYLYGRLLAGSEADRFVSDALTRFPRHAYLLRSAAYRALTRGDYAETERLVDVLRGVDVSAWQQAVDLELRALAASGKIEKARTIATECLKSPSLAPGDRMDTVVAAELLAHFEPASPSTELAGQISGENERETKELRLIARVHGCETVPLTDLQELEDEQLKAGLELELLARKDPQLALAQVLKTGEAARGITAVSWALLYGEAVRLDPNHPAIPVLSRKAPLGHAHLVALTHFIVDGTDSADLEDFPPDVLAAASFVRSRKLSAGSTERQALLTRAARQDMLHGSVSIAMKEWSL